MLTSVGRLQYVEVELSQHRPEHRQVGLREGTVRLVQRGAVLARVENHVESQREARHEDGREHGELAQVREHRPDYLRHWTEGAVDLRERQNPCEKRDRGNGEKDLRHEESTPLVDGGGCRDTDVYVAGVYVDASQ